MNNIIPDANIFTKLFLQEKDSQEARIFIKTCVLTNARLIVPELFKYEIYAVTIKRNESLVKTIELFEAHVATILTVVSPSKEVWLKAEEITKLGHQNSGYPSLYDSIYHALAIESNGTFLTADKRHYEKVKNLGHIELLENWESIFSEKH